MNGCLRYFGIALMLIGCAVATLGALSVIGGTSNTIERAEADAEYADAYFLGAAIGATTVTAIYGCVAFSTFVVGAIIFWIGRSNRNRKRDLAEAERRHQEQLEAMMAEKRKRY